MNPGALSPAIVGAVVHAIRGRDGRVIVADIRGESAGPGFDDLAGHQEAENDHRLPMDRDDIPWPRAVAPPDAVWQRVASQNLIELDPLGTGGDDLLLVLPPFDPQRGAGTSPLETSLSTALRIARHHAVVALVPKHFLFAKRFQQSRALIAESRMPQLIVDGRVAAELTEWINPSFELALVVFAAEGERDETIKFARFPSGTSPDRVTDAVRSAMRRRGGRGEFSFIHRRPVSPEEPWIWERFDPEVMGRKAELRVFGETRQLGDLFRVVRGLRSVANTTEFMDDPGLLGIPVVDGGAVGIGWIDHAAIRRFALTWEGEELEDGDFCFRSIRGQGDRLRAALVVEDDLPLVASESVIALRPTIEMNPAERRALLAFLGSRRFEELLAREGQSHRVLASALLRIPVPVIRPELQEAIDTVEAARDTLAGWSRESEFYLDDLFGIRDAKAAYRDIIERSRLFRLRVSAAESLGELPTRVRTQFPLPIAWRWRSYESRLGSESELDACLETFETVIAYLGGLALIAGRVNGISLSSKFRFAETLATSRGIALGHWRSVIDEAAAALKDLEEDAPLVEFAAFVTAPDVTGSVQYLTDRRNDDAHLREMAPAQLDEIMERTRSALLTILEAAEWITDYPLQHVRTTAWDSIASINRIERGTLRGDHPIVPFVTVETADNAVEAGSLYIGDRHGNMHLARPVFVGVNCPLCGNFGVFMPERRVNGEPEYKGMERGHTVDMTDQLQALLGMGLFPADDGAR